MTFYRHSTNNQKVEMQIKFPNILNCLLKLKKKERKTGTLTYRVLIIWEKKIIIWEKRT